MRQLLGAKPKLRQRVGFGHHLVGRFAADKGFDQNRTAVLAELARQPFGFGDGCRRDPPRIARARTSASRRRGSRPSARGSSSAERNSKRSRSSSASLAGWGSGVRVGTEGQPGDVGIRASSGDRGVAHSIIRSVRSVTPGCPHTAGGHSRENRIGILTRHRRSSKRKWDDLSIIIYTVMVHACGHFSLFMIRPHILRRMLC